MTEPLLTWMDGSPPGRDLKLPLNDRGLLYGEGLFETLLVISGKPFRLVAHLDRLQRSAVALSLPLPTAGWRGRLESALAVMAGALGADRYPELRKQGLTLPVRGVAASRR